jgi:hypothetical protein
MKMSAWQCQCKAEMFPGFQSRDIPRAKEYLHWLVLEDSQVIWKFLLLLAYCYAAHSKYVKFERSKYRVLQQFGSHLCAAHSNSHHTKMTDHYRVLRKYIDQAPVIYRQFDINKFRDLCKEQ